MDDLTLVGVHDDGEHVLLTAPDGRRFRLRVDDALRAAVRRDRARLGQLQIELDGKLRPRDVQARIRAGHTAEEIADEAKVPLAYVRRYEGPVLAEREHMAGLARASVVRRGPGSEPTSLEQAVLERLGRRGVDPDAVRWDSWRADDGSWSVAADYPVEAADGAARARARWSFDHGNRHATPLDDAARLLSVEEEAVPSGPRRLAPVPGVELEGPSAWLDLPEPAAGPPSGSASAVDLLDTLRERRGRRTRPLVGDEEDTPGSDPVREAIDSLLEREGRSEARGEGWPDVSAEPSRNHPAARAAGRRPGRGDRQRRPPGRQAAGRSGTGPDGANGPTGGLAPGLAPEAAPQPPDRLLLPEPEPVPARPAADTDHDGGPAEHAGARKRGRASVPSWDDIVFGSRRE